MNLLATDEKVSCYWREQRGNSKKKMKLGTISLVAAHDSKTPLINIFQFVTNSSLKQIKEKTLGNDV